MTTPAGCQLIGRWPIVEANQWDRRLLGLGNYVILKSTRSSSSTAC